MRARHPPGPASPSAHLGAANNDAAIRRAARWGYPWIINPHATVPMVAGQWAAYREALAQSGNSVPESLPMMRELYVAKDREAAYMESEPYLAPKYQAYASWGQDKALPGEESFNIPYQELARDRFLLGSPEEVVQEIQRYATELDANYLIFRMQWPGMAQAQVLRQIELMGDRVIPRVKGSGAETPASGPVPDFHPGRTQCGHRT